MWRHSRDYECLCFLGLYHLEVCFNSNDVSELAVRSWSGSWQDKDIYNSPLRYQNAVSVYLIPVESDRDLLLLGSVILACTRKENSAEVTSLSVQELASSVHCLLCSIQSEDSCNVMISITVNLTRIHCLEETSLLLHVFASKIHGHFSWSIFLLSSHAFEPLRPRARHQNTLVWLLHC